MYTCLYKSKHFTNIPATISWYRGTETLGARLPRWPDILAHSICCSWVWTLLHVICLVPRILRCCLIFGKFVGSWAGNSMEKNPALETNRYSSIEEVPCLLWNLSMHSLSWTWWICSLIPKLSLLQDFYLKFYISFWYLAYMLHLASHLPWFEHSSNRVSYLNGSNHCSLLIHLLMLDAAPTDQLVPTAFGKVGRSLWVIHGPVDISLWCTHTY